jgi:hypothetical protein
LESTPAKNRPARPGWRLTWIGACLGIAGCILAFWLLWFNHQARVATALRAPATPPSVSSRAPAPAGAVTKIYAHNLRLHQGPDFRVYIRWLSGQLTPSHAGVNPSFDDPESFYLNISNGVLRANIGDIDNYLNSKLHDAPLRGIKMSGTGDQVKITGTLHKIITLPVELSGVLEPATDNRIQIHVTKIDVLKVPFKALLGKLNLTASSFVGSQKIEGVEVVGNDIYFDPGQLLPPPHIRGKLTRLSMSSPDVEAVYGEAANDVARVEQWRNFLRLKDGTLDFGKLTMHDVDLIMIDITQDAWFDLDLANYQAQLVKGYTRMTPEAGLQIFMPNVSDLNTAKGIDIQWFKNRNVAPPPDVVPPNK